MKILSTGSASISNTIHDFSGTETWHGPVTLKMQKPMRTSVGDWSKY